MSGAATRSNNPVEVPLPPIVAPPLAASPSAASPSTAPAWPWPIVDIAVARLSPRAILPRYQTQLAAGMDLSACLPEGQRLVLPAIRSVPAGHNPVLLVPCGFAMALPPGFEAQVRPRSGLATRHGVTMPNAPGTIDADYRGEMKVPLINLGPDDFIIEHGLRIAQMVIARVEHATVRELPSVSDLGATQRGAGGFGSTGVH